MNEYIEREYLVDHIHACMENDRLMKTATKEEILQMVADSPSADVQPVVHCSECANNYSTPHNPMCDYMNAHLWPDSFCSKGNRKGEDNEID